MSNIYKIITIHLGRQKKKDSTIQFLMNTCDTRISLNESFDRSIDFLFVTAYRSVFG